MKTTAHIKYKTNDGNIVPGITTVLAIHSKPALYRWNNQMGLKNIDTSKYVDDLAQIGTLAHAMVTDKLTGKETDTADYSKNQIDLAENSTLSFWQWEKEHHIEEVYFVERPLVSEKYRFGGTLDIYAKINGKNEIIDLKTGRGLYDEHFWQCATLKALLEENHFPVHGTRIVNIPRAETEAFVEKTVSEKENVIGWGIFKSLLRVYQLEKEMKG